MAPAPIVPIPVIPASSGNFIMSFTLQLNGKVSTWVELVKIKDRVNTIAEKTGYFQNWPSVWLKPNSFMLHYFVSICDGSEWGEYSLPLGDEGDEVDVTIEYNHPVLTLQAGNQGPLIHSAFDLPPCVDGHNAFQVEFKNSADYVDITNFNLETDVSEYI